MKPWLRWLLAVAVIVLVIRSCFFMVDVTEFAVVTRLGKVRHVFLANERGLHAKLPAPLEDVMPLDARVQILDLPQTEYLTNDKTNVTIETYCVWQIRDPLEFLQTVTNAKGAESRLGILIGSELGAALGDVPFARLVSTDPEQHRLTEVVASITQHAAAEAARYGIEVLDVRVKRLNFPDQNQSNVFERMRAERGRMAKRFRSEGEEESLKIRAEADQEKSRILAEARAEAERVRGQGEAESTRIFGEALAKDPDFYKYLRTLQAYRKILDPQTTLILPGDSELMRLLTHGQSTDAAKAPVKP